MKLLQRVQNSALRLHLAPATLACYQRWIKEFLAFHRTPAGQWVHPAQLDAPHVESFLTSLAKNRKLSASSQNQALNAIVFLYTRVLADELPPDHLGRFAAERARRPAHLPTVLSQDECVALIRALKPGSIFRLMTELLYGTGLRTRRPLRRRRKQNGHRRHRVIPGEGTVRDWRPEIQMNAATIATVTQRWKDYAF